MSSVCAEQHKFHASHHLLSSKKQVLREVDIPPRKLLTRRQDPEMYTDSPRFSASEEALLRKFLPYNTSSSDDEDDPNSSDSDPFSSDHFRMFEFKVRRCTYSRSHDWTDCPFAHPGEKARRRDPRRYHYSGTVCADYRRGGCSRGDSCEFAHGVFECWLHPARYRTEACKDGRNCKRKVCFFAHTPLQLRILPIDHSRSSSPDHQVLSPLPSSSSCKKNSAKYLNSPNSPSSTHCCLYCRQSMTSSPTSTLLGMPHLSPPMSPYGDQSKSHFSSSGLDQMHASPLSYKDVLSELMTSIEAIKFNNMEAAASSPLDLSSTLDSSSAAANYRATPSWIDVSSLNTGAEDHHQQQIILSPSTPSPLSLSAPGLNYFSRAAGNCSRKSLMFDEQQDKVAAADINGRSLAADSSPDPDLGWVNDLLM